VFNINPWEMTILAVIFLIVFGPERIPEVAAQIGRIVRDVHRATDQATGDLRRELELAARETEAAKAEIRQAVASIGQGTADAGAPADGEPSATPPDTSVGPATGQAP